MKKAQMLWWGNLVLLASFLVQTVTGIFHEMIPMKIFEPLHGINGFLLIALAIIHLAFNWNWIKNNFLKSVK